MTPKHNPLPCEETFPSSKSTDSFWLSQRSILDSHRSTPDLPVTSDIAIIGAGLSGISTAYYILRECEENQESPPTITIFEARTLCSGATGRNGGHLKLSVARFDEILKRDGLEAAKELAEFQLRQIYEIKDQVERESIDCDFLITRSFDVFMKDNQARENEDMVNRLVDAGIDVVKREIQIIPERQIELVTGVNGAKGARGMIAAQLWAYKLVAGLTERIIDQVNLQTHTTVTHVSEKREEDGYFHLSTNRGDVKARKIVFANNGYIAGILPMMRGLVVPWKGTCSYCKKQQPANGQARTFTYNVSKDPSHVEYINHRLDGNTIIGGAREVIESDQAAWLSVADDSTLIREKQVRRYFEDRLETYWQDWSDAGAKADQLWTGIMGYTPDEYPLIGQVPGRKSQYMLAGYSGAGMTNISLSAKGIAEMIVNNTPFEKTGIPRIYKVDEDRLGKFRDMMNQQREGTTTSKEQNNLPNKILIDGDSILRISIAQRRL